MVNGSAQQRNEKEENTSISSFAMEGFPQMKTIHVFRLVDFAVRLRDVWCDFGFKMQIVSLTFDALSLWYGVFQPISAVKRQNEMFSLQSYRCCCCPWNC